MTPDMYERADVIDAYKGSVFSLVSAVLTAACAFATATLLLPPKPASAQSAGQLELVYTQPVEGVYTQGWTAQLLGQHRGEGVAVYVVGEGKLGDFFGVVSVDCRHAEKSEWLATGGYLSAQRVPAGAILSVRKLACGR